MNAKRRSASAKRAFDLVIAALMLVATSPVLLIAILAVRMSSPGPALFSQVRVGQGGAPFRCHKLRTMYEGTPSLPTHEAPANAVTAIGKVLRGTKIDELPQLWNVLKGEMSLVGPRPCLPTQTELIGHRRELGVLQAFPGITGLAQVRGIDMSDPKLCAETDAEYLKTASIGLDIRILIGTIYRG
ncbi:sugar transferase [Mesorhizobium amorphae]|uniref:Glycosyltransferase n=1 Tax=Mesorhizobium amorphae CCNWGS0123 TaxID=1082933 RepID=G6YKF6_9HYPH|nr:sugar transferase [Mesorhizobium amorphae]ANT50611.1 lipid carrier--UDP-N-acetylgalactosaminyltransferase [Mesorhizobium amorphae CCNWGS0123]EHH03641.1 glycosyltransferase [Mesorhizobium amorphae CCNWGS0123]GLR42369.1 sugar transferase [Mesorhizobium amorphae]